MTSSRFLSRRFPLRMGRWTWGLAMAFFVAFLRIGEAAVPGPIDSDGGEGSDSDWDFDAAVALQSAAGDADLPHPAAEVVIHLVGSAPPSWPSGV